jgi:hypothetical protein
MTDEKREESIADDDALVPSTGSARRTSGPRTAAIAAGTGWCRLMSHRNRRPDAISGAAASG